MGLGDAVYSYPIVKNYVDDFNVVVKTNFPIVFDSLPVECTAYKDARKHDIFPEYTSNRSAEKSQYGVMLESIGLPWIPFEFDWQLGFTEEFRFYHLERFTEKLNKSRKQLCIVKEPCAAHVHKVTKNFSMTPNIEEYQQWIIDNHEEYFFVSVGHDEIFKKKMQGIGHRLNDKTSVQDLITLCSMASLIVTQVGHLVPIAQGLGKPVKIFYPDNITDRRYQHINQKTMEIT